MIVVQVALTISTSHRDCYPSKMTFNISKNTLYAFLLLALLACPNVTAKYGPRGAYVAQSTSRRLQDVARAEPSVDEPSVNETSVDESSVTLVDEGKLKKSTRATHEVRSPTKRECEICKWLKSNPAVCCLS
jgi:hypothetical protein